MKYFVGAIYVCIFCYLVSGRSTWGDEDDDDKKARYLIGKLRGLLQEQKQMNEEKEFERSNQANTAASPLQANTAASPLQGLGNGLQKKLEKIFADFEDMAKQCGGPPTGQNPQARGSSTRDIRKLGVKPDGQNQPPGGQTSGQNPQSGSQPSGQNQQPQPLPPPVKISEIDATLQKVQSYMVKAGDQMTVHQQKAMELESELEENATALDKIIRDHFKLGHDMVNGFIDMSKEAICTFGELFQLMGRMNMYGIENVPACDGMLHAIMEHIQMNGMDLHAAFCNLADLLPSLSQGLREDIHCLTQDVHSTLESFTQIRDSLKQSSNQGYSDVMALFSAATFRALRSGEDSMKMLGAVESVSHYVDEYMKMKNSNTLTTVCTQYWNQNGKKELDMQLLRDVKELLDKIKQRKAHGDDTW